MIFEIIVGVLVYIGSYYIITEFVVCPTYKAKKAVLYIKKKKSNFSDSMIIPLTHLISKIISISEAKKNNIQKKLYAAELDMTAEFYVSKAIASAIIVGLFSIPSYFISPIFSLLCIVLGIIVYFREVQVADDIIKKKRKSIERELVLFSSTISQAILSSRDLIKIFESFRKICGPEFNHQINITLADMKTGSYENALKRFDLRINSSDLSDIIRGLLAILRGDDQQAYFQMLTHDLIIKEKEELKREALKRPNKLKGASYLLMFCAMAIIFYAIGYEIVSNLNKMF